MRIYMRFELLFYETSDGQKPVEEFCSDLV